MAPKPGTHLVKAVLQAIAAIDQASETQVLRKIGVTAESGLLVAIAWAPGGKCQLGSFEASASPEACAQDIYERAMIALRAPVAQQGATVDVDVPLVGGGTDRVARVLRTPPPMMTPEQDRQAVERFMAEQPEVIIVVPADTPVNYNGFRMLIKADTPTTVPKPIADLIEYSREQTKRMRRGVMLCLTCGIPHPCRCLQSPSILEGRPLAAREAIVHG